VVGVRRELGRLYRQARAGELTTSDASKLGNLLYLIGRLIGGEELETRVQQLERAREQARREPWTDR
jgi:hypothetical protein